ncbi:MAG: c-type cytochrome [Luteitalea sp.]|nr:c-type cytochrome [Luteitalea sp.]
MTRLRSRSGGSRGRVRAVLVMLVGLVMAGAACRQDMHDAPRFEPLEESDFFRDKRSARPLLEGTVARGHLRAEEAFYTGKVNNQPVVELPMPLTRDLLERGRERFNIYCSPCHGHTGEGQGMVVRRGFKQAASFHDPRLRGIAIGYFVDVMTNGFGQMPDYRTQVAPRDRWAIAAYIRALQLSRSATVDDVPGEERRKLETGGTPGASTSDEEGSTSHE